MEIVIEYSSFQCGIGVTGKQLIVEVVKDVEFAQFILDCISQVLDQWDCVLTGEEEVVLSFLSFLFFCGAVRAVWGGDDFFEFIFFMSSFVEVQGVHKQFDPEFPFS